MSCDSGVSTPRPKRGQKAAIYATVNRNWMCGLGCLQELTKVFAVCMELDGWRREGTLAGCPSPPCPGTMVYKQTWTSGSLHKYPIC